MKNLAKTKKYLGLIVSLCLVACSDEVDRRDELGIEEEDNGRYELVAVDGQKKEFPERADSLHHKSAPNRVAPAVATLGSSTSRETTSILVSEPTVGEQQAHSAKEEEELGESTPGAEAVVFAPRGAYTVQIGGYRDADKAKGLVRELKDAGYPAYAIARPGSREMRVRIGYFKTQVDADRFGAIFKADRDMEYWVDKRENE
jgi:cell division septation protein DedD